MSEDAIRLRGNLSPEDLVRFQINRCNVTASFPDRDTFNANVLTLMRNLPSHKLLELKAEKYQYVKKEIVPVYKYSCGNPMGTTPKFDEDGEPLRDSNGLIIGSIYRNRKDDWNWDGGEPILVSPIMEEVRVVDYDKLFEKVMMKLEEAGLTWKIDMLMVEGGRIEKRKTKQTPTFKTPTKENDESE